MIAVIVLALSGGQATVAVFNDDRIPGFFCALVQNISQACTAPKHLGTNACYTAGENDGF